MDKKYVIKENNATIYLDKEVYPLISTKKAALYYLEKAYIEIKMENNQIIVEIELIDKKLNMETIVKEFINDCLRESLRYDISKETKNIRELILGRALYSSCMEIENDDVINIEEDEDIEIIDEENFDLDEIAVNWFDENRKEEN